MAKRADRLLSAKRKQKSVPGTRNTHTHTQTAQSHTHPHIHSHILIAKYSHDIRMLNERTHWRNCVNKNTIYSLRKS